MALVPPLREAFVLQQHGSCSSASWAQAGSTSQKGVWMTIVTCDPGGTCGVAIKDSKRIALMELSHGSEDKLASTTRGSR